MIALHLGSSKAMIINSNKKNFEDKILIDF